MLMALAALPACTSPEAASETDSSSGMNGGDSGMMSLETGTAEASTTTEAAPTSGGPTTDPTTSEPGSTSGPDTTTDGALTSTTGPDDTSTGTTGTTTTGDDDETTGEPAPKPWVPKGCPKIFAQTLLPTFELEISEAELAKLHEEWDAADDNNTPEHPLIAFKYEGEVIKDATVRLRGNATWWPDLNKLQLQVSFNTHDKKGRFMGLRKLLFDAARYNESFLRDRLALAILRDVGVPAPCANNARLVLNGEYYGLFTSIEKVDKEFLERRFEDPEANLYKRAKWEKQTNESDPSKKDLEVLLAAETIDQLGAVMDLDQAVLEWATEAVIPNIDGTWGGGLNYYLYNDPKTGFNVIPWDLDATFTRLPFDTDLYTFIKPNDWGRPFFKIATDDPVWFQKYIDAIEYVLDKGYDVQVLQDRMDLWAAQIATAAAEDPNKPFSTQTHLNAVKAQRAYIPKRAAFVKDWLKCWKDGGTKDAEGHCKPP